MSTDRPWTKCPHQNVIFCPLYLAMHGLGGSCDDGKLDGVHCAVDRGMNYERAVAALRARHPAEVAMLEFEEAAAESKAQRRRNMRLLGLH